MESKKINISVYVITILFTGWYIYSHKEPVRDLKTLLIIAAAIIVVSGIVILRKKEKPFSKNIPVFVCMWVLLYILLPLRSYPELEKMPGSVKLDKLVSNWMFSVSLFSLIVLRIVLRKIRNIEAVAFLSYVCAVLFWSSLIDEIMGIQINQLLVYMAALFFLLERYAHMKKKNESYFFFYNVMFAFFFIVLLLYVSKRKFIYEAVMDLFDKESNWQRIMGLVLSCGIAGILEDYKKWKSVTTLPVPESLEMGLACLLTSIYMLSAKLWPSCFNLLLVFCVGILGAIICESSLKAIKKLDIKETCTVYYLFWVLSIVFAMTAGKTLNVYPQYFLLVAGILILRTIVAFTGTKAGKRKAFLMGFWGIAAPLMLFFAKYNFEVSTLESVRTHILYLVASMVLWLLLLTNTWNFNQSLLNGKYPKKEYTVVPVIQVICICFMCLTTVILLLNR